MPPLSRPRLRPPPWRVTTIALSGAAEPERIEAGAARLAELGFEVSVPEAARGRWRYFAGSDDERLAAMQEALASEADIVLFTRGGYGISRLLHRIDWQAVAASGKLFCGYSDVTAFSMAALAQAGYASLAGPVLAGDFASQPSAERDATEASFLAALARWAGTQERCEISFLTDQRLSRLELAGPLWGTNLAMLAHLVGTPWLPSIEGGILVLEDIGEYPYRIERMFWQLKHAGILDRQQAVLLGEFTDCQPSPGMRHPYVMAEAIEALRAMSTVPVLTGFPFGHGPAKHTLPMGLEVKLTTDGRRGSLSW